jgi:hypothetical protein
MTPLQEFVNSIWALLPSLAPYLVVAWLVAFAIAAGRLAVDEYNGEARPIRSILPLALWLGSVMTLLIVLTEASDKGLIAHNTFAGPLVGSLAVTVSLLRGRARNATPSGVRSLTRST